MAWVCHSSAYRQLKFNLKFSSINPLFILASYLHVLITAPTHIHKHHTHTHTPTDIQSTLDQLMDYFIREDSASSDGAHHKRVRQLMTESMHTTDDIPFTQQEVQAALEKFDSRKAPGEDALTSEILIRVSRSFPSFFTEVY